MENIKCFIGKHINALPTPAFVVSLSKVERNCKRMIEKSRNLGINLRPHVKTHKTVEGALVQTGNVPSRIVVSTVAEADFYAKNGFDDIVLGHPATAFLFKRCENLQKSLNSLHFFVNSIEGVKAAIDAGTSSKPISTLLKVSAGYERAGIPWDNTENILSFAKLLQEASTTTFQGIYVHCGNSYSTDRSEVVQIRNDTVSRVLKVRDLLASSGIPCKTLGVGSTPSCSLEANEQMKQLTEMHTGNYAFYDCQQESYGACSRDDIAGRVLTRVVSHHSDRNQIMVDLGFTGLTKQGLDLAVPGYGAIQNHPNLKLSAMSQEMGKVDTIDGSPISFDEFPVDSTLCIFPYHACATSGMYNYYFIHNDDDIIIDVWHPVRGW